MAIYLQCEEDKIRNLLIRAEMVLQEKGQCLSGYALDSSEEVRIQAEAVYKVLESIPLEELSSFLVESKEHHASYFWGDWSFYHSGIAEILQKIPLKLQVLAAYSLAMFGEMGLKGLLIPTKQDLLAGVWLYQEYDHGEAIIRSQELLEDAYDQNGMLLSFSCTALLMGKSFSEAVSDGCHFLKDYLCAIDLHWENQGVVGKIYRMLPGAESDAYENDAILQEDCEDDLDGESLNGVDESSREMAGSEMLTPIAQALQMGYQKDVHSSLAEIVKASGERKQTELFQMIEDALEQEKRLLVISEQGAKSALLAPFKTSVWSPLVWMDESDFGKAIQALLALSPKEPDFKDKILLKRYEENQKKWNRYLEMLESETVAGLSLISLLEAAAETPESRFSLVLGAPEKQVVFGTDFRPQFAAYIKAWKDCCYTAPDGSVCLDFTSLSTEEVEQLKEMLGASEVVITRFLEKLNEYGYSVHKIYQAESGESQKEYFKSVMRINDFMLICADLLEGMEAEELPEATSEEEQAAEAYREYLQYRKIAEKLGDRLQISGFAGCDAEQLETLKAIAERMLRMGLDRVTIPIPRQLVRDSIDLERNLREYQIYTDAESLQCRSGNQKNTALKAICEALTQPELFQKFADAKTYPALYDFFGEGAAKNAYLFWLEQEWMRCYTAVTADSSLSEETQQLLREMSAVFWQIGHESDSAKKQSGEQQSAFFRQMLAQAVELFYEYYTPFHEMEKEIFAFLHLSYSVFDNQFPERMLMEFILDWKELLERDGKYDHYVHESAAIERSYLHELVEQISEQDLTPEEAQEEFDHFWLQEAAVFWTEQKGFDAVDYEMSAESLKKCEKQVQALKQQERYGQILAKRQQLIRDYQDAGMDLENWEREDGFERLSDDVETVFSIYPVWLLSPDRAVFLAQIPDLTWEHVVIADGERISWSQILPALEGADKITIFTPEEMLAEAKDEQESIGSRGIRMQFPVR